MILSPTAQSKLGLPFASDLDAGGYWHFESMRGAQSSQCRSPPLIGNADFDYKHTVSVILTFATPRLIAYPYPVTYRCEVPSEDKTREPLCRPLPVQTFPPPPPIRPPPVGSPAWIDDKQSASAEAVNAHGGAWARGTPAATRAKGVPPSLTISDVQRPGSSLSSASAPSRSSPDRNDIGAWGRWPSPSPSSIGTPPGIPIQSGLKAPSTSSNSIASSAIGSGTAQELPPLEHNSSSTSPQLSATSSEGDESGWWPAVSTLNNNVVVANQGFERVMEGLSIEDDMDSAAEDGCAVPAPAQEPKNLWTTAAPVQVYKSLWANEEESQEPQLTLLCTEHGVTCKKGICKVYAAQLKAQQRAEREKKREKEREKRAARGVDKGRGKNKGKGETGDASTGSTNSPGRSNAWKVRPMPGVNPVRPRPPHLIKGASGAKDGDAAPPPARGAAPSAPPVKRNNSNTRPPAATVAEKDARSAGGSMATWGNPSKGPSASQASKHDNDDARSVAASTASGWGNISEGPWRTDNNAEGKQPSRSWTDQVQDEDDARSVTASTTGGWGHLSESGMPW
ncbi:hypothetical protein AcW1_003353 [Taiwanofungus camphoratus]|nr:hypothetical protein AcV5_002186 [Antrodia cinnamomea]KAI0941472.1 hypothetical protein AcW1_003353 [Antrodia cinnamomea]KAI0944029.1 hypothetical protein AcV7_001962 [Antrodia cinnamomea]